MSQPNPYPQFPSTDKPAKRKPPTTPTPAYLPVAPPPSFSSSSSSSSSSSPLYPSPSLISAIQSSPRRLISRQVVPIRSALSFRVSAGQIFRLTTPEGAQVGDLNLWSATNPRERFWAARTRQLHAAHLSVGDRLWSCLPYLRPLATITADSLGGGPWSADNAGTSTTTGTATDDQPTDQPSPPPGIYGVHDLLGTRCDPYVNTLLSPQGAPSSAFHCHSNLTRAVLPLGLDERDVHDVLNVFQMTGLDARGRYWMGASPARPGDYLEFLAETDLLGALSACPGGDLSRFGWGGGGGGGSGGSGGSGGDGSGEGKGEGKDEDGEEDADAAMLATCRPLGIEVYELEDRQGVLSGWTPSERPGYTGHHGIRMPVFGRPL